MCVKWREKEEKEEGGVGGNVNRFAIAATETTDLQEFNWIFKYLLSYYHLWGNRSTSTVHTETQTHRHMHTHLFSLSFMTDDISDALANVFHAYIAPHRIHSHLFANIRFSLYYHFNSIKARKKPTQHNIRPKVLLNLMAFSNFII